MLTYQIEGRIVVLRAVGTYTVDEAVRNFDRAMADPALPAGALLLLDGSGSETNTPADDIRSRFATLWQRGRNLAPRCAVVVSKPVQFGNARLFATYSQLRHGVRVEVFDDLEAGKRWLLESADRLAETR